MAFNAVDDIKRKLDQAHDTDIDYLPPRLHDLRKYVFQVHANAEASIEHIIWLDYLKSSKGLNEFSALFSRMSFFDKLRIIKELDQKEFPYGAIHSLNELRNVFAHRRGEELRSVYEGDGSLVEAYRQLERSHDALNEYWAARHGL